MKARIRFLSITVLGLVLSMTSLAQLPACRSKLIAESDLELPQCTNLKEFELRGVRICMPKEYTAQSSKHRDFYRFLGNGISLTIDVGDASFRPTVERRKPNYQESVTERGDTTFWKWSVEDRMGWKFIEGLNIWDSDKKEYRAGILLTSNEKIPAAISSSIFDSVCLVKS